MRSVLFLVVLVCPLQAELIARFQTSQGVVDAILQYQKVPQAVANFVTLVQGTRPWIDEKTGAIARKPFYDGTKIHRISNNDSFKFAQGGSRIGDGSDGPGYTIKDEFDDTLTHVPYVLSMGNKGPNSNGSGFFFTGNIAIPSYDKSYTLFGFVTDSASRGVIDAMIAAGANGTTIEQVTILRTDAAAAAFDEHAHNLPTVIMPGGTLNVTPGVSAIWQLDQALETGDLFRAFDSTTLADGSWTEVDAAFTQTGLPPPPPTPPTTSILLDTATRPKAFYHLSLARHPGSLTPSTLTSRTVTLFVGSEKLSYAFNSSGTGGTCTYTSGPGIDSIFPFTLLDFGLEAHYFAFVVENLTSDVRQYFQFRVGCDSATGSVVSGRNTTSYYTFNPFSPWSQIGKGAATIEP